MFVFDKQGCQWAIDEGLRSRAERLVDSFPDLLEHVVLDHIIFLRLTGSKSNWHGKCFFIGKAPMSIIPKFAIFKLANLGMFDMTQFGSIEEMFDIRYIIAINDDSISHADGDLQKVEDVTLVHEMLHIHRDGDKLVRHDIEDFAILVDRFGPYWTNGRFKEEVAPKLPDFSKIISGTSESWTPEEST